MSAHIAQIKTATAAAIQRLGGLEAASPVGVPGDAGAFSGKTPQRWWRRWNAKRLALARHLYANDPRSGEELVAEVNAVDADVLQPVASWHQFRSHMTYYDIPRHPDANRAALARRGYKAGDPMIVAIRVGREAGRTCAAIAGDLGCSPETVSRLAKQFGIAAPPRPVVAKAQKPPKPAKARSAPPPVVLHTDRKPTPPRVAFQTVEAYLAAGGKITRCPTVALLETQAEIPQADMAAVQAYYAAKPQGNWRAQRVADWKKAKREGRA